MGLVGGRGVVMDDLVFNIDIVFCVGGPAFSCTTVAPSTHLNCEAIVICAINRNTVQAHA
jgi:hypothetical protein